MMRHRVFLIFSTLTFLTILACQQDEETLYDDPQVRMTFYNQDSLNKVNDTLLLVSDSLIVIDVALDFYADSAQVLLDSIIVLEVLVRNGEDEWIPVIEDLNDRRLSVQDIYSEIEIQEEVMKDAKDSWNEVAKTIKNGEVLVASITNNKNGRDVLYIDSSSVWRLPLSNTEDDISVAIVLGEKTYNLAMNYLRSVTVNEFNNVVIQAYGIETGQHEFDSVKLKCATPECIDYESSLDIYF